MALTIHDTYYYHTSLSALKQDDIFNIMLYGGWIMLVILAVLLVVILWQFKQIGKNLNDSITSSILKAIGVSFYVTILFLIVFVIVMTVFIGLFPNAYTLNPAESLEWFLHTHWSDLTLDLHNHLEAIEPYGEEAVEQTRGIIGIIYMQFVSLAGMFIGLTLLIFGFAYTKVDKMVQAQSSDYSTLEHLMAKMSAILYSVLFIGILVTMINSAIDTVYSLSNTLLDKSVKIDSATRIEILYKEVIDPEVVNSIKIEAEGADNEEI